jgi:hypothetical protein
LTHFIAKAKAKIKNAVFLPLKHFSRIYFKTENENSVLPKIKNCTAVDLTSWALCGWSAATRSTILQSRGSCSGICHFSRIRGFSSDACSVRPDDIKLTGERD